MNKYHVHFKYSDVFSDDTALIMRLKVNAANYEEWIEIAKYKIALDFFGDIEYSKITIANFIYLGEVSE